MRRSNIFWGIVLIMAAALLLLRNLGVIENFFTYFWVFALMLLGIWFIITATTRKPMRTGEKIALALEDNQSLRIKLDYGAGDLKIHAGAAPGNALDGTCAPLPVIKTNHAGAELQVNMKNLTNFWNWLPGDSHQWDLALARDIPIVLDIDCGASTSVLDLRDLKVTKLDLDTGASTTDITLPANAGMTRVNVDTGAATILIKIPEGVAAQIHTESGLASNHVSSRFPKIDKNLYRSPEYDSAPNRAEIRIESGLASVDIQ